MAAGPTQSTWEEQRVFISYRRRDCQAQANGLHDGLRHRLGAASIFMDIDSIPPGVDFEQHIRDAIHVCDVVLVLIGDDWLNATGESGGRRIDEPEDFVRLEVESALASPQVRVIPVLVEGAQMPRSTELPESIRQLARINAIELSDRRWVGDIERLARLIEEIREQTRPRREPHPPAATTGTVVPRAFGSGLDRFHNAEPPPPPTRQVPPTAPPPRSSSSFNVSWLLIPLPLLSCGLLAWVPPVWAAVKIKGSPGLRNRLYATAAGCAVTFVGGGVLLGGAPVDAAGTPTGAASNIGLGLMLLAAFAGTWVAIAQRNAGATPRDERQMASLPGVGEALAKRQARNQYRDLVRRDPGLAREIFVGRPDMHRPYDDGGLIDATACRPPDSSSTPT